MNPLINNKKTRWTIFCDIYFSCHINYPQEQPSGGGHPSYSQAFAISFFHTRCTSFRINSSLHTFFLRVFVIFHSSCSHAQVFGKILVHEFHIWYSHTECFLLSCYFRRSRSEKGWGILLCWSTSHRASTLPTQPPRVLTMSVHRETKYLMYYEFVILCHNYFFFTHHWYVGFLIIIC